MADFAATTAAEGIEYLVTFTTGGDQASGDEITITVPIKGRIHKFSMSLISGAGTTIQPILRRIAQASADAEDVVIEASAAAARFNPGASDLGANGVPYHSANGTLFIENQVDSDTDNVLKGELIITSGWRIGR